MVIETEPKTPDEKTLIIKLGDGRKLSFPDQEWYPVTKTIAGALHKQRRDVGTKLHQIIDKNPSIESMTVRELEMLGRLKELKSEERPQTIICDRKNLTKIILAYPLTKEAEPSRKASSKPKKPQLPSNFNPLSQPNGEKQPLLPASKDRPTIRMPHQILAENSVNDALSHLANGTLQNITHDIKEFLEQVAKKHVRLARFEDDPIEGILTKILNYDSTNHLNRFFRINLDAMLYDLWDAIDINERKLKREKEIIEICNLLKEKGYDKERIVQELLDHFPNPPKQTQEGSSQQKINTPEQMREIVIIPNPKAQVALALAPIREEQTIFEEKSHNQQPQHGNTGKKRINDQATQASGQQEKDRKKLREEILSQAVKKIWEKVLVNNYDIPPDVRITLGRYLPPKTTIPGIFLDASQEELNRLVIERLNIALSTNPNREQILFRVNAILNPEEPVQDEDLHTLRTLIEPLKGLRRSL